MLGACGDNGLAPGPVIDGDWWDVASTPELGAIDGPTQQPVDFAVWQAADGTWNIWSCIRFTHVGGNTRLFFHWQSPSLTATNWTPVGIAMEGDPSVGEALGGLQAPFVFRDDSTYHLFYGAWESICSATSPDGLTFTRTLDANGQCPLFSEGPSSNTRDPMVLRVGDHWNIYYTAFADQPAGAVYARTSQDLVTWSDKQIVAAGGVAGSGGSSAECPFVVARPDGDYYLFRTQVYGADAQTTVYRSVDPLSFGIDNDLDRVGTLPVAAPEVIHDGDDYYLASLKPTMDGIRIAHLRWN